MAVNVLPANDETFALMKGQNFEPIEGEAFVYIKVVAIKPVTMKDGDPKGLVESSQGVLVCGQAVDIQAQLNEWLTETLQDYAK